MNFRKKILSNLNKKSDETPKAFIGSEESYKPVTQEQAKNEILNAVNAPAQLRNKIPYEVWTKSKKSDGTTFEKWRRRVDKLVSSKYGIGMDDFEDWRSADTYEANKTVEQGFRAFMRAQKSEFGDMMY